MLELSKRSQSLPMRVRTVGSLRVRHASYTALPPRGLQGGQHVQGSAVDLASKTWPSRAHGILCLSETSARHEDSVMGTHGVCVTILQKNWDRQKGYSKRHTTAPYADRAAALLLNRYSFYFYWFSRRLFGFLIISGRWKRDGKSAKR